MNRFFSGNAKSTPSTASAIAHAMACQTGNNAPVTSMYAGSDAVMRPVMYPAAVAALCTALFSRSVICFATPSFASAPNARNARTTDVTPMPIANPVVMLM
jgi:hypothetical protein